MTSTRARAQGYLQRHEFVRHVLTLLTGTAIGQVLTMLALFVIGKLVHPADVNVYTVVYTTVMAIVPAAAMRYDVAIVMTRTDADARQLVKIATVINTITAVLLTVLFLFIGGPVARAQGKPEGASWMYTAGALGWIFAELQILSYWLTRRKKFALASQNKIHQSVTSSVAQVAAAVLHLVPGGLILGALLGRIASLVNLLRKDGASLKDDGSPHRSTRELMADYKKMPLLNGPNAIADFVRLTGIAMLVPALFGASLGGQFGMAWLLLQAPIALLSAAISQVFMQRVATAERGEMLHLCKNVLFRAAVVGVVPFALIALCAPWALPWFMPKYPYTGWIATILTPWLMISLFSSPLASVMLALRRQGALLAFSLVYCAAPLLILWQARDGGRTTTDMLWSMGWISAVMSLLLLFMIGMTLAFARAYDQGRGPSIDREEAEAEAAEEETEDVAEEKMP